MKISELIPLFDDALKNKNETNLFLIGQTIARKYSYNYYKKVNIKYDWELIADEITCNLLRVAKETDWQEDPRYYFGCIKQGIRFRYLNLLKDHNLINESNTLSLDALTTNEFGENLIDRFNLQPVTSERSSKEELILNYVHKIMELADQYLDKKNVEQQLGLDHKLFLFICKNMEFNFTAINLVVFLKRCVFTIYILNVDGI